MHWYVCPIFIEATDDQGATRFVPGISRPAVRAANIGAFIAHAHNPKNAPETALVGVTTLLDPLPDGWELKTVEEAQFHFELVNERAPTADEVW